MLAQHQLHAFRYDGHGHSLFSDGSDTPGAIVHAAVAHNIQIIGLSDHDTVEGLPAFLDTCHQANREGHHLLPIPSVEITTAEGDLLVTLPFPRSAAQFIQAFPLWKKGAPALQVIEESILRYHAICVFLHPEAPYLRGFTRQAITAHLHRIPKQLHRFVGLEVNNWMTQVFFWNRARVQEHLHRHNDSWNLAEFAFTDFHRAKHVGRQHTLLHMRDLSPSSFVEAISQRRISPQPTPVSMSSFVDAAATSIRADLVDRFFR